MSEVVVYTALFGHRDPLWSLPPVAYEEGIRYVAFTDERTDSVGLWTHSPEFDKPVIIPGTEALSAATFSRWEVIKSEVTLGSPRKQARYYKVNPHKLFPQADASIWVDSNLRLLVPPSAAISSWLGSGNLAAFKHPDRKCLFREGQACVRFGKDSAANVSEQLTHYSLDKMPRDWGLASTRCIIRRHTAKIRALNERWWAELCRWTLRDQVSFPYVCWKEGVRWGIIPKHACEHWKPNSSAHFWFNQHGRSIRTQLA